MTTFVRDVMLQYFDEYSKYGIFSPQFSEPKVKVALRQYLSEILHCEPSELALVHNTSEGMNFYSHSIKIPEGKSILILDNEYPSNVYPWEHWKERGVSLRFVETGETPDHFYQNLKRQLELGDVYLLSLSPVHWCTGMVFDLEIVSLLCQEYGVRLVLDGSQAVGHIPLDFSKVSVDFCAFAAWKWLLGPLGLGVVYLSNQASQGFRLLFKGQASVVNDSQYLPYRDEWKSPVEQFEHSTVNFNDWVYFLASLRFLDHFGFSRVQERIFEMADLLKKELKELGFSFVSDHFPTQPTGILAISGHRDPNTFQPDKIQSFLKSRGIITAVRLGNLRMAPHIGIEPFHIQKLKSALEDFLTGECG